MNAFHIPNSNLFSQEEGYEEKKIIEISTQSKFHKDSQNIVCV